jgi:uncharacterized protein (DUF433 family)
MTLVVNPIPLKTDADGVVRVGESRVTLDTLVAAFREGATAEEIVQQYPSLQLADLYSAIGYYLKNQSQVEDYLAGGERASMVARQENEKRFDPHGVRDRLIARRR